MPRVLHGMFALGCAHNSFKSVRCAFSTAAFGVLQRTQKCLHPEADEKGTGLTILSANVAGLRAVVRQDGKRKAFQNAVRIVDPDVICIQEHKLQESHVEQLTVRAETHPIAIYSYPTIYSLCERPASKCTG